MTDKLREIGESKELAIKAKERAKDHIKQKEAAGRCNSDGNDDSQGEDLEAARESYTAVITELSTAKEDLMKLRHDYDAAGGVKAAAINQAAEAEVVAQANKKRTEEVTKEIVAVQESIEEE